MLFFLHNLGFVTSTLDILNIVSIANKNQATILIRILWYIFVVNLN